MSLNHNYAWGNIRRLLSDIFEVAFQAEEYEHQRDPNNYLPAQEFINLIHQLDPYAYVNTDSTRNLCPQCNRPSQIHSSGAASTF